MSTWLCLHVHRQYLHVRALLPTLRFLYCDKCEAIR